MSELKALIHRHCLDLIEDRIVSIKKNITEARLSGNNETKSSAGDKYETGRAMAQLEQEKATAQLMEAEKIKNTLLALNPKIVCEHVFPGALITTSAGVFYLAAGLGVLTVYQTQIFAVSTASPAGAAMKNLKAGDSFTLNGKSISVLKVE